jgi:hypothetical protein
MDVFYPSHSGWSTATDAQITAFRDAGQAAIWGDQTEVRQCALSFYPGASLLIAKDPGWTPENAFLYGMFHPDGFFVLDGTSPAIHQFNSTGALKLNNETLLDYLSFFCFFVRGGEGPFYVVRGLDGPYLTDALKGPIEGEYAESRDRFRQIYQSPRRFGHGDKGQFRLSVTIYYSNAVFISDFEVDTGGMIAMINDVPVISDLPLKIVAPLAVESSMH